MVLAIHHFALAIVIGCLLFAAAVVPPRTTKPFAAPDAPETAEHPAFHRVMTGASAASVVWVLAAVTIVVLTFADLSGQPLSPSADFSQQLFTYVTDLVVGQARTVIVVLAVVVSTLTFLVRSSAGLWGLALLSLSATIPMSLIGHAAGSEEHYAGVGALVIHWVGVLVWVGGVAALAFIAPTIPPTNSSRSPQSTSGFATVVIQRFSAIASVAFVLVLASGVLNSVLRLSDWDGLVTRYGQLILLKFMATLVLGAIGWLHRQWSMSRLATHPTNRTVWRLVVAEVLIMAGIIGVTSTLSRAAPPIPQELEPALTPAQRLTGYPLPPELTWDQWLTQWRWDWLWIAFILIAAAVYLLGVRRTPSWSWSRTASWLAGLAVLGYVTGGAPTIYGKVLFSMHTTMLLTLTLIVSGLLVLGRPFQLATQSVARRTDGSRGLREWLDLAQPVLAKPVVSGTVLVVSLLVFYSTPVFQWALQYWLVHQLTNLYFLVVGCWVMHSVLDPGARRLTPRTTRITVAAMLAGLFLLWAVVLVSGMLPVVQPDWFAGLERTWGPSLRLDQQLAGIAVLLTGFTPIALVGIAQILGQPPRAAQGTALKRTPAGETPQQ
jgi:putative copper resistance protein D